MISFNVGLVVFLFNVGLVVFLVPPGLVVPLLPEEWEVDWAEAEFKGSEWTDYLLSTQM
jgi:hypothetical protein